MQESKRRFMTDDQFISAWHAAGGSPTAVAKLTGVSITNVLRRRSRMADRGVLLKTVDMARATTANGFGKTDWRESGHAYEPRVSKTLKDGIAFVFSDAHYWPGKVSIAHRALCKLAKELKPNLIIANGDLFDGATISRHDPMGWQKLPSVVDELGAVKARLWEIEQAAPQADRHFTIGNHDSRMDRRLASESPQFQDLCGFRLSDHIKWPMSYSLMINESLGHPLMVRHAMRGGIHAVYNNTLHSGISIVTGHLHAQLCRPFTDYRGTRYGIDAGCLADIDDPAFSYTMDAPVNWRSGFAVLTFDNLGRLLPPEFCEVQKFGDERRALFRGRTV